MKRILLITIILLAGMTLNAQKENFKHSPMILGNGDKLGIMLVHFGTTHKDTRDATIEELNKRIRDEFPGVPVAEAFSSRIIIKKLAENGIKKITPSQALNELRQQGCTHILVQSSHIIDGAEMESLKYEINENRDKFKEIRTGNPLLYSPDDYRNVIDALENELPDNIDAVVLVGHGTYTPATASYAMLDYMLKSVGKKNWHVGTIEGFPAFEDVVSKLKEQEVKSVLLAPVMFVAGEHAKNDIAREWKEELEKEGYNVKLYMKGLGENSKIRDIFITHIKFAKENKYMDIMSKKNKYAK